MKSWIPGRTSFVLLLISIFCLYFLSLRILSIRSMPVFGAITSKGTRLAQTTRTVLYWNTMFGNETFYFGNDDIFRDCPVNDCYATHARNFMNVDEFDAVLFHGNELDRQDLPGARRPGQLYIYVNLESPENRPLLDSFYADYFNRTMTYGLNSDLPRTYAIVRETRTGRIVAPLPNATWNAYYETASDDKEQRHRTTEEVNPMLSRVTKGKSKPVAWFVSNCGAKSGRSAYVEELARYLEVDIYGKCGDYECPRERDCFREIVEPHYFFYLSFENSLCEDYVTEKLYNPLRYDVVPVVYGGANYSKFAPPCSYVNALDFDTPRDLAVYLRRLMKNRKDYEKYFAWKRHYRIENGLGRTACRLCELLHRKGGGKSNADLSEWYSRDTCPIQRLLTDGKYATRAMLNDTGIVPRTKEGG